MTEFLIISLFGFPGALLSLLVSAIAILKNKYWVLFVGAILFLPFCYYLNGTPYFRGVILLPLFHLGSAFAIYKNNKGFAWILFLPDIFLFVYVLYISIASNFLRT